MKKVTAHQKPLFHFSFQHFITLVLLGITTIATYYPSLHYSFQFDDLSNITRYFDIRHNTFWSLFFSKTRWLIYWLNSIHYHIAGFNPFSYRVGSITIHVTNGILIFCILSLVLSRLKERSFWHTNAYAITTVTSMLFLLHPVQTQTVSYIIQSELEGLAALFMLTMVVIYLYMTSTTSTHKQYISGGLLLILGILSSGTKETTIICPFLLALVDWFFVAQGSWVFFKKRIPFLCTLFTLLFASYAYLLTPAFFTKVLGLNYYVKNNIGNVITHNPNQLISPYLFFISQFKVILHYLTIFIWPFNISVEYDWKVCRHFFSFDCIVPFAFLVVIAFVIAWLLKRNKSEPLCFGALWFFTCLSTRSTIMPSPELLVDYKTYCASFGWLFILATGIIYTMIQLIAMLKQTHLIKAIPLALFSCLLLSPLSYFTLQRNNVWRSGIDFWGSELAASPHKARAHNNYGVELSQNQKEFAASIAYFQKAIELDRHYADPHNNLAVAYAHLGDFDKAIEAIKSGIAINALYPEAYNNLATFLMQKNDFKQAKIAAIQAIRLRPYFGKALYNLGRIYLHEENLEQAWECFKKCCMEGDYDVERGFFQYGKISLELHKYDEALIAFKKILQINPYHIDAHLGLATAYVGLKQYDDALVYYQKAHQYDPNNFLTLQGIGEIYLLTNKPHHALEFFTKARQKTKGDSYHILGRLAICYEQVGNIKAAFALFNDMLTLTLPAETRAHVEKVKTEFSARYGIS